MVQNNALELMRALGIPEAERKSDLIHRYGELLRKYRTWAGLTSRSFHEDFAVAAAESCLVAPLVHEEAGSIADIGAGGGILGLVLAILLPKAHVVLIEGAGRKAVFLVETAARLALSNVEVCNRRAEELVGVSTFSICVSRAAGKIATLQSLIFALLEPGGRYVGVKSSDSKAETEAARPAVEAAGGKIYLVENDLVPRFSGQGDGSPVGRNNEDNEKTAARTSLIVIDKV